MKYYNLLFYLAFFFSLTVKSQNFEIGMRTGLNFATLRTGDNTGSNNTGATESLTRLNLSITSEYTLSNHFGLDASLGYQGKGGGDFDEESILRVGIDNFKRKLDYLSASVLVRYYPLMNSDPFQPFITLGPGFSYLIKTDELGNEIVEENIRGKLDISSIAGIGAKFSLNENLKFEVLGVFDRGWSKTIRQQNESLFNQMFWFSVGLKKDI
ncbi:MULTISPECIES: outer membrane beta-barrel protein [Flagellimonas]|uniref:PorT family protein n=1 Tax=Flagellimonas hadalis TaxID=2597517 RepID=A0A5N5IQB0_9FLAO|nr:outer membrane beta-barrel protein [Allomuricauda hadalis]KAB5487528.1 PorT family protein [Allomuricauda hadalis]RUA29555.1 MAG: hypothetical protein DSY77_15045 [Bacteroidota bacterium]